MPKIDLFFDELVCRGGNELHLGAGAQPMVRIHGELVAMSDSALDASEVEALLFELLSPADRARLDSELSLEFAHPHKEVGRFRGNVFRRNGGFGAAFRLVPRQAPKLVDVECPDVLVQMLGRRSGLVVIASGAANGKSSTLAALVEHVNRTRPCHVVTIESPIEFVHGPLRAQVTQRQVGLHQPSYRAALDSAARENADVVVVSELGSSDVIDAALNLAASGVLVLVTVRANNTVAALRKLTDGASTDERESRRRALADVMLVIVSQKLVETTDGKRRVAAHEVLLGGPSASAIREGRFSDLAAVMDAARVQGMQTMDFALERLVLQGRIAPEAALEHAVDKESFARLFARPSVA